MTKEPARSPAAARVHGSDGAASLLGLIRVIDRRSRRHIYGVGRHPGGEFAGELGALDTGPEEGSIPLWVTSDGRVVATGMPRVDKPSVGVVAEWVLEPRSWLDDGSAVRMRAMARRAQISFGMLLRGPPSLERPAGKPAGYLRREGPGTLPLYGAAHPVTGDQLLTTDGHEAERLGYVGTTLLGYLAAAAPLTGLLGMSDTDVAWGKRGQRQTTRMPRWAIDRPLPGETVSRNAFVVTGWALWPPEPIARVEITINGVPVGRARMGLARPDVAGHLGPQSRPNASVCGFEFHAGPSALPEEAGELSVDAVIVSADGERFRLPGPSLVFEPPRQCLDDPDGRVAGLRARVETAISRSPKHTHEGFRILAFTHHLGYGGAQRYFFEFIKRLVAEPGISCTVVSPETGPYTATFEALGVPVHVTGAYGGADADSYEGRMLELAAWAARESFDLVWVNCLDSYPGADLGIRLDIPVVWSIHESFEIAVWWAAAYGSERARPYARGRAHTALREAGALIFAADATRRQYEPHCPPERMLTFPYAFELDAMARYRRGFDPRAVRERLGIAEDATVILSLGTIEPRKGQTLMAQAFARVSVGHPDAQLVLVGDQPNDYSAGLHEYLEHSEVSDRIRVVPLVAEPYEWHGVADLFVLASDVESLPIVILEAMAFETPVVATSVYGVPELIEDGVNGYLCEPSDLVSLCTALDRALSARPEKRREVGRAGAQRMRARHDARTHETHMRSLMTGLAADRTSLPADILAAAPRSRARSVPERVSVLIPTLDAGPEFERALESIGTQEGLGALEVVVIDSGSSDETVSLARASGARVHGIPAAKFNHGRVRNQLAEMATGDVLLMTVQDATLTGKHAIRDLVLALKSDSRLAAVSARQMARAEADLYSKFLSWRRNEIMPPDSGLPARSLARSAFLVEDVCAAIRRSAWEALRFRELSFAEDIDFGVRAYDAGWRTGFSDDAAVWHHHDRDAAYFLSRGAVHRHTVAAVLNHVERIAEAQPGLDALAAAMPTSVGQLEAAISQASGERESLSLAPYLAAVANELRKNPPPLPPTGELALVSAVFDDRPPWEEAVRAARDEAVCAGLRRSILRALEFSWLRHYALAHTESVARDAAHAFVARCAASNLGEVVGDAMRDAPEAPLAQRVAAGAWLSSVSGSTERAFPPLSR